MHTSVWGRLFWDTASLCDPGRDLVTSANQALAVQLVLLPLLSAGKRGYTAIPRTLWDLTKAWLKHLGYLHRKFHSLTWELRVPSLSLPAQQKHIHEQKSEEGQQSRAPRNHSTLWSAQGCFSPPRRGEDLGAHLKSTINWEAWRKPSHTRMSWSSRLTDTRWER